MIADDYLNNWKQRQENRKTHSFGGIDCKIASDMGGNITINATIKPEAISMAMVIAKAIYQAAHDASALIESQNEQKKERSRKIKKRQESTKQLSV